MHSPAVFELASLPPSVRGYPQLAGDPILFPGRIPTNYFYNESAEVQRDRTSARLRFPLPKQPERPAMPADQGCGFDQQKNASPNEESRPEDHPKPRPRLSVAVVGFGVLGRMLIACEETNSRRSKQFETGGSGERDSERQRPNLEERQEHLVQTPVIGLKDIPLNQKFSKRLQQAKRFSVHHCSRFCSCRCWTAPLN